MELTTSPVALKYPAESPISFSDPVDRAFYAHSSTTFSATPTSSYPIFHPIPLISSLYHLPINSSTVLRRSRCLNQFCITGPDQLLKERCDHPLHFLFFGLMLTPAPTPEFWKKGQLTPSIYNSSRHLTTSYRPVNIITPIKIGRILKQSIFFI